MDTPTIIGLLVLAVVCACALLALYSLILGIIQDWRVHRIQKRENRTSGNR